MNDLTLYIFKVFYTDGRYNGVPQYDWVVEYNQNRAELKAWNNARHSDLYGYGCDEDADVELVAEFDADSVAEDILNAPGRED